jgi:hypothetical protein
MTASTVHVTNLLHTGVRVTNHLSKQRLTTAGMVHVTNLTPGSECNPTRRQKRDERERERRAFENDFLTTKKKPRPRSRMGGDDRDYHESGDTPKLLGRQDVEGVADGDGHEENVGGGEDPEPSVIGRGGAVHVASSRHTAGKRLVSIQPLLL